jgi:hypothetical protein
LWEALWDNNEPAVTMKCTLHQLKLLSE